MDTNNTINFKDEGRFHAARATDYARALIDPMDYRSDYPDNDMTTSILKSIMTTYSFQPGSTGAGLVLFTPHSLSRTARLFAWNGTNYVYAYDIAPSEDLSDGFTWARPVSGCLSVKSNTRSGNNVNLSGSINAASYQFLPDMNTLDFSKIVSYKRNDVDMESQVEIENGVIALMHPDGQPQFHPINTSAVQTTSELLKADITLTPGTYATLTSPVPYANMTGNIDVFVDAQLNYGVSGAGSTATPEFNVTLKYDQIDPNDWTVTNTQTIVKNVRCVNTSTGGVVNKWDPYVKFSTYVPGFLKEVDISFRDGSVGMSANVTDGNIHLHSYDYYSKHANGPGSMIAFEAVDTSQYINITGKMNYEAVPDAVLARQMNTTYSSKLEQPLTLALVEYAIANYQRSGLKFLWNIERYQNFIQNKMAHYTTEGYLGTASGFTSFLKKLLYYGGPAVGQVVGSLVGSNNLTKGITDFSHKYGEAAPSYGAIPYVGRATGSFKKKKLKNDNKKEDLQHDFYEDLLDMIYDSSGERMPCSCYRIHDDHYACPPCLAEAVVGNKKLDKEIEFKDHYLGDLKIPLHNTFGCYDCLTTITGLPLVDENKGTCSSLPEDEARVETTIIEVQGDVQAPVKSVGSEQQLYALLRTTAIPYAVKNFKALQTNILTTGNSATFSPYGYCRFPFIVHQAQSKVAATGSILTRRIPYGPETLYTRIIYKHPQRGDVTIYVYCDTKLGQDALQQIVMCHTVCSLYDYIYIAVPKDIMELDGYSLGAALIVALRGIVTPILATGGIDADMNLIHIGDLEEKSVLASSSEPLFYPLGNLGSPSNNDASELLFLTVPGTDQKQKYYPVSNITALLWGAMACLNSKEVAKTLRIEKEMIKDPNTGLVRETFVTRAAPESGAPSYMQMRELAAKYLREGYLSPRNYAKLIKQKEIVFRNAFKSATASHTNILRAYIKYVDSNVGKEYVRDKDPDKIWEVRESDNESTEQYNQIISFTVPELLSIAEDPIRQKARNVTSKLVDKLVMLHDYSRLARIFSRDLIGPVKKKKPVDEFIDIFSSEPVFGEDLELPEDIFTEEIEEEPEIIIRNEREVKGKKASKKRNKGSRKAEQPLAASGNEQLMSMLQTLAQSVKDLSDRQIRTEEALSSRANTSGYSYDEGEVMGDDDVQDLFDEEYEL
jgi:hypothetical protein